MPSSARELAELPELQPTTGPALEPDLALRALDDTADDLDEVPLDDRPADSPGHAPIDDPARSDEATRAPGERQARPPKPKKSATPADPLRARVSRAKSLKRDVLQELYLAEASRNDELQEKLERAQRDVATARTIDAAVIDTSVNDLVGDAVDLLSSAAQLTVRPQFASAVAIDDAERERIVLRGARVAKIELGAKLEQAPLFALIVTLIAIALGKYVAYRLAVQEARERGELAGS